MKLKFGNNEIEGCSGDYTVFIYGNKKNPRTKEVTFGLKSKHYFGRLSQCLIKILDIELCDSDAKDTKDILNELKEFRLKFEEFEKEIKNKEV